MQIPRKSQTGEQFKPWVVNTINAIIDYLNASKIRKGPGILVDETPSGTIIKLADNRPATPPQVLPAASGGGGATGIDASVSGGTASISLTGGTGSVNMVGSGSVSISENGDGEIVFTGSGGGSVVGFPDYSRTPYPVNDPIAADTTIPVSENMWLIGYAGLDGIPSGEDYVEIHFVSSSDYMYRSLTLFHLSTYYETIPSRRILVPVFIPIKAGDRFYIYESGHVTSYLKLYYI